MKIALLASRLPPANDGVGDHAHMLACALEANGHDVVVIAAGEAAPTAAYRLELTGGTWGAAATARAIAVLRRQRVDALVVEYTPFHYGVRSQTPLAMVLAARAQGIRTAVIVHEAFYRRGSRAARGWWRADVLAARDAATLAAAQVIVVPSEARAAAFSRRMPGARDRIRVIPIGANVEPMPLFRRRPQSPATIVSFGVVAPRRRLERSVAAVVDLLKRGDDVRLDIIGRTYDEVYAAQIVACARRAGVGERVRFCGELASAQISQALAEASAAVHAAQEGSITSSGSLLALLAHGVPTVALRTRYDDAVFSGAVHYADDDQALASSLHALVSEPRCATSLASAAAACYRANFSWERIADQVQHALVRRRTDAGLATA
jgi:glycosyltransferase involved in cell wall biosynthesis